MSEKLWIDLGKNNFTRCKSTNYFKY